MTSYRERPKGIISRGKGWVDAQKAAAFNRRKAMELSPLFEEIRATSGGQAILDYLAFLLNYVGLREEALGLVRRGVEKDISLTSTISAVSRLRRQRPILIFDRQSTTDVDMQHDGRAFEAEP